MRLPCLVVYLKVCDNRIEICCKLSLLYLFSLIKQENTDDCFLGNYLGDT